MLAHDLFLQNQVSKQNWQTDTSQAPEDFFLNLYQMGCHLVTTYQQGKIVNHIKSQSTIFEPVATKPSLHDMLPSNQQLKADQTLQHQTYQLYVRRAS